MVDRIGEIIADHLLCFELICPHINRTLTDKINLRIGLLDQDLTALDHTLDQFGDIKTFEYNFIISKLKLIQSQKILDHEIHLGSFIHNHITIKLPAFRIITDAFFQSFCISLD